ncbi:hypothetical protein CCR95_17940 [Thiocystis minor]|uniref:BrnT family toxin n=1 Tax=Thiocystis minor TaxID=61597 RepID=UPI0019123884|nr:BrnT family toxin [Thiocystis minor]MBK5965904.1 hypothetical protein [Thiocystis minor]
MEFEWDDQKAQKNEAKHDISFAEAITVFQYFLSMTYPDIDHSDSEDRYLIIGATTSAKVLVVSHVFREDTIRIISARKATTKEYAFYEQQSNH